MAVPEVTESPDSGKGMYDTTPFGGDTDTTNHYQPVDLSQADNDMPGEQPDPRLC